MKANTTGTFTNFKLSPDIKKTHYIPALKHMIMGFNDKKPIVTPNKHGDVIVVSPKKKNGVQTLKKFGLYLNSSSNKIEIDKHSQNKIAGLDQGAMQNAVTHLVNDNPTRSEQKHPYKIAHYQLAFKSLDKLLQTNSSKTGEVTITDFELEHALESECTNTNLGNINSTTHNESSEKK